MGFIQPGEEATPERRGQAERERLLKIDTQARAHAQKYLKEQTLERGSESGGRRLTLVPEIEVVEKYLNYAKGILTGLTDMESEIYCDAFIEECSVRGYPPTRDS